MSCVLCAVESVRHEVRRHLRGEGDHPGVKATESHQLALPGRLHRACHLQSHHGVSPRSLRPRPLPLPHQQHWRTELCSLHLNRAHFRVQPDDFLHDLPWTVLFFYSSLILLLFLSYVCFFFFFFELSGSPADISIPVQCSSEERNQHLCSSGKITWNSKHAQQFYPKFVNSWINCNKQVLLSSFMPRPPAFIINLSVFYYLSYMCCFFIASRFVNYEKNYAEVIY